MNLMSDISFKSNKQNKLKKDFQGFEGKLRGNFQWQGCQWQWHSHITAPNDIQLFIIFNQNHYLVGTRHFINEHVIGYEKYLNNIKQRKQLSINIAQLIQFSI